jgi:DNA-binding LytR/AlgR family response regulator
MSGGTAFGGSLRVLVVDDEQLAREELCFQLNQVGDVEIVGQATNGPEALAAADELEPDVVFLDVQMPGLTGFEVARSLLERADDAPVVVFVTAYDQHALEAFEVNAVDYLLKPVDPGRLQEALARVRRRVGAGRPEGEPRLNEQVEQIVKMMASRQSRREQVAVKAGERFWLVQADEIIYASLADESITIVTGQVAGTSNYRTWTTCRRGSTRKRSGGSIARTWSTSTRSRRSSLGSAGTISSG